MKCFQLVKSVLDELYERIPAKSDSEKDSLISEKLEFLSKRYNNLLLNSEVNYSEFATKFAYIYRYVTCHANIVYQVIESSAEIRSLFELDRVNVTCVGGGPGSDFLGIIKYLLLREKKPFLRCSLFDKEQSWSECWNDVDEKLDTQFRISTNFEPFDVTRTETWAEKGKYLKADLFTMIYFMSEVHSIKETAEAFFSNLFENAKKNSLFLYIDNKDSRFYSWFDSLASKNSFDVLRADQTREYIEDGSEEKQLLAEYFAKFGPPKLKAQVAIRICRKL